MFSEDESAVMFASRNSSTSTCFGLAQRSLKAAEIQINRVWDVTVIQPNQQLSMKYRQELNEVALIELHFFFVSMRNIYRYLHRVIKDPTFTDLAAELEVLNNAFFKHYSSGRVAFEHIDQRLQGQPNEKMIVETEENGARRKILYSLRWREGLFLHSDQQWDISREKFASMKEDVEVLISHVNKKAQIRNNTQWHPIADL